MPYYTIWEKRLVFLAPAAPGYPDQGLPPVPPGYPDQGLPPVSPGYPSHPWVPPGEVPPGIWPPPGYPDQGLPGGGRPPGIWPRPPSPGRPDQGLPQPPQIWPRPPAYPDQGLPGAPAYPDQGLPGRPPYVWPRPPGGGFPTYPDQGLPRPPVPTYAPLPEDLTPPSSPPTGPPDLESPGYWVQIVDERGTPTAGFVQTAIDSDPDHVPKPPTKGLPGTWLAVYQTDVAAATYAWQPTKKAPKPA
jgi:hypothetical protein